MPSWCVGSAINIGGMTEPAGEGRSCWRSPSGIRASSVIGNGSPPLGGEGEKSPVTGDSHAGICGSRRPKSPPAMSVRITTICEQAQTLCLIPKFSGGVSRTKPARDHPGPTGRISGEFSARTDCLERKQMDSTDRSCRAWEPHSRSLVQLRRCVDGDNLHARNIGQRAAEELISDVFVFPTVYQAQDLTGIGVQASGQGSDVE